MDYAKVLVICMGLTVSVQCPKYTIHMDQGLICNPKQYEVVVCTSPLADQSQPISNGMHYAENWPIWVSLTGILADMIETQSLLIDTNW